MGNGLVARADDERWRSFADVVVQQEVATDPIEAAKRILAELPGCAVVAVAISPGGCVVMARSRKPLVVLGADDIEAVAVTAYEALLSLAATSEALGSAGP